LNTDVDKDNKIDIIKVDEKEQGKVDQIQYSAGTGDKLKQK